MELEGKTVVLTGAASGIGAALLARLAKHDVRIVAADQNVIDLSGLAQNASVYPWRGDLSQHAEVDRLFEFALSTLGQIDLFIANAGFAYFERIGPANWNAIETIFRLNVTSPLYAAVKMKDLNAGRPYCVVMTASAMSHLAVPGYAVYAATKAALDRFADGYRFELPPGGRLMLVYPISTRTRFFHPESPVPFPAQTADYVAGRIMTGLRRDQNVVYPSRLNRVTLPLMRLIPAVGWVYQSFYARYLPR